MIRSETPRFSPSDVANAQPENNASFLQEQTTERGRRDECTERAVASTFARTHRIVSDRMFKHTCPSRKTTAFAVFFAFAQSSRALFPTRFGSARNVRFVWISAHRLCCRTLRRRGLIARGLINPKPGVAAKHPSPNSDNVLFPQNVLGRQLRLLLASVPLVCRGDRLELALAVVLREKSFK